MIETGAADRLGSRFAWTPLPDTALRWRDGRMGQWIWAYVAPNRGVRLIIGNDVGPSGRG